VALKPIAALAGPTGDRWSGNLRGYESDRLGFLLHTKAEFGGMAKFDSHTTIVNDPQLATEILLDRNNSFAIRENYRGERLGTAEIEETRRLRPALNPGMRRARAAVITPSVPGLLTRELPAVSAGSVDPLPMLERVCAQSIAGFYFGPDAHVVVPGIRAMLDALDDYFGNPFSLPTSWPTPGRRRIHRCHRELESVLVPLLRERAHRAEVRDEDLATVIVSALRRTGESPSLERVGQMVIGSLLAAQRVPAAAAAWMLWEVARAPEMQLKLRSEAARYSGMISCGALPNANGYRLAMAVVLETLRLHPPTWLLHRNLLRNEPIGGYNVPRGHNLLISPYVLHRDETRFENAGNFWVDRWLAEQPPPSAFMPFGRGLHGCPGSEVAVAMLVALLLTTLNAYEVTAVGSDVVADPRSTLLPSGLQLVFTPS